MDADRSGTWRGWTHPAWIGVLATLLYLPTIGFSTVNYDDPWLIEQNQILREPSAVHLRQIWLDLSRSTRLSLGSEYLPIRDLSVTLDHWLFGEWYGGHHMMQVLLYGFLCALFALVVERWYRCRKLAWLAGLLFAWHPLHVEAAAWLSERKGILCGIWVALAMLALHRYVTRPTILRWLTTAALLVLALWSKALGVAAVAAVAAFIWLRAAFGAVGGTRSRLWVGWLGWVATCALAMYPVLKTGADAKMVSAYHGGDFFSTVWLMAKVHAYYIKHLCLAGPYAISYPISLASTERMVAGLFGALAAGVAVASSVIGLWFGRRWALIPIWWCAFLAPVSQLATPLQNYIADRYMLLPSWSGCVVIALATLQLRRRLLQYAIGAVILATAAIQASVQVGTWSSSERLFEQALLVSEGRHVPSLVRLAQLRREQGKLQEAWQMLGRAQQLAPHDGRVLLHQALIAQQQGDRSATIRLLREAIAAGEQTGRAHANLALLLSRDGSTRDEALELAHAAVRLRPEIAHNLRTLGVVLLRADRPQRAERALRQAIQLAPNDVKNRYNLAVALAAQGRFSSAVELLLPLTKGDEAIPGAVDLLRQIQQRESR